MYSFNDHKSCIGDVTAPNRSSKPTVVFKGKQVERLAWDHWQENEITFNYSLFC